MDNIEVSNKKIFIPKNVLNKLNINKNDKVVMDINENGAVINFKENPQDYSLERIRGILTTEKPTNAVDLKKMAQKGDQL
jgi:bifunctional DNA-binding transcriptional regulator/antitoxin component of YhaV-PrlF toxin-antitoxin module